MRTIKRTRIAHAANLPGHMPLFTRAPRVDHRDGAGHLEPAYAASLYARVSDRAHKPASAEPALTSAPESPAVGVITPLSFPVGSTGLGPFEEHAAHAAGKSKASAAQPWRGTARILLV